MGIDVDQYDQQQSKAFLLEHVRTGTCSVCQCVFVRDAEDEEKSCPVCLKTYRAFAEAVQNTQFEDISFFVRPRDMGFVELYFGYDAGRG